MYKSKITFILVSSFLILAFVFCQKKLFGFVEVHGQIRDYLTNEPISVYVELAGNDMKSASSYARETFILAKTHSKSDGSFSLKSKQSKRPYYFLHVNGEMWYDAKTMESQIDLSKNTKKDVGVIYAGFHNIICKISLVSKSSNCIRIYDNANNSYRYFSTDTTFIYRENYNVRDYETSGHNLLVKCEINSCSPNINTIASSKTYSVPINSSDTLALIISY